MKSYTSALDEVEMKMEFVDEEPAKRARELLAALDAKDPKRKQLVHTARVMFETRLAKYNDPHNLEWDFDDVTDKWERHAYSAFMDLQEVEEERDQLRGIIAVLCDQHAKLGEAIRFALTTPGMIKGRVEMENLLASIDSEKGSE
jgi:hypothetical protein